MWKVTNRILILLLVSFYSIRVIEGSMSARTRNHPSWNSEPISVYIQGRNLHRGSLQFSHPYRRHNRISTRGIQSSYGLQTLRGGDNRRFTSSSTDDVVDKNSDDEDINDSNDRMEESDNIYPSSFWTTQSEGNNIIQSFEKQLKQIRMEIEKETYEALEDIKKDFILQNQKDEDRNKQENQQPMKEEEEDRDNTTPITQTDHDEKDNTIQGAIPMGERMSIVKNTQGENDVDDSTLQDILSSSSSSSIALVENVESIQHHENNNIGISPPLDNKVKKEKKKKSHGSKKKKNKKKKNKKLKHKKSIEKENEDWNTIEKELLISDTEIGQGEEEVEEERRNTKDLEQTIYDDQTSTDLKTVIRENVIQLLVTLVLVVITHFTCRFIAQKLHLLPSTTG